MGKWSDMDSDSERLPSGFTRIGYDADDQTYSYRGPDGRIYESEPGCRYGQLWPIDQPRPRPSDAEIEEQNTKMEKDSRDSMRMMLPFALLVFVFLILLFKLINRPDSDHQGKQIVDCVEGSHEIQIHQDDTCWAIAEKYSMGVDELLKLGGNEKINCDKLKVGQLICVPDTLG